ncbi:MAG: (Fe-S)-binding protein [Bacteroidetes bacterium]|nr:(Fe-S)-binding protein [Bacteroidota bacterium]
MFSQIIFILLFLASVVFFAQNIKKIRRNINLGKPLDRTDRPKERWMTMMRVALGQSKMVVRPVAGIMHIFIYVGFVIINIEVIEIIIDGIAGTHRFLSFLGSFYNFLIGSFEILAALTLLACFVFLIRRNVLKLKRFWMREMTSFPRSDANAILITEILLMTAFLTMNATDSILQSRNFEHYLSAGAFPVGGMYAALFSSLSSESLMMIERICWWFHIIGILAFLNYLPYSKHFHILLAFPNTYYSNLEKKGKFTNMDSVTQEVKLMLDPAAVPPEGYQSPTSFGAKDVYDLTWKNLMDAYSCTECGRCSSVCPANQTGKLLSPRKIMMDTRDRLEEVGKNIDKQKKQREASGRRRLAEGLTAGGGSQRIDDGKNLFNYISEEELLACTSCNACTEACPVNIDPLNIITEMRRYLVMEQSKMPAEWQMMMNKIETNGAPWQFAQADRANWISSVAE